MKFMLKKAVASAVVVAALAGCSSNSGGGGGSPAGETVDLNGIANSLDSSESRAEKLALVGERVVYTPQWMLAEVAFDMALQLDSKNVRAKTYSAILSPVLANRGILKRIAPLVTKLPKLEQAQYAAHIQSLPEDQKAFWLDGQENISTERDVQSFAREIQGKIKAAAQEFRSLNNQTLTLNIAAEEQRKCWIEKKGERVWEFKDCKNVQYFKLKVAFADFEAMRLGALSYAAYIGLGTAYDATGYINLANKFSGAKNITEREFFAAVRAESDLGKLADVQSLKDILALGAEGVEAVRLALNDQQGLCAAGKPSPSNRPGYLFSEGICVNKDTAEVANVVEAALRGAVEVKIPIHKYVGTQPKKVGEYVTMVDINAPLNGGLADLKQVLPTKFDRCGQSQNLGDGTVGGGFVRGDAEAVFSAANPGIFNRPCH